MGSWTAGLAIPTGDSYLETGTGLGDGRPECHDHYVCALV